MIDSDTLFTDGVMRRDTYSETAGQIDMSMS